MTAASEENLHVSALKPGFPPARLWVFTRGQQQQVHAQSWNVSIKRGFTSPKWPSNRTTGVTAGVWWLQRGEESCSEMGNNVSKESSLHDSGRDFRHFTPLLKQINTISMSTGGLSVGPYGFRWSLSFQTLATRTTNEIFSAYLNDWFWIKWLRNVVFLYSVQIRNQVQFSGISASTREIISPVSVWGLIWLRISLLD